MEISTEKENDICFCQMKGRLDGTTSTQAEIELLSILQENKDCAFVIELTELDYLSSAGLRVLLIAAKNAKSLSTKLHLCSPTKNVEEVLQISGFTSILPLHPDRESARTSLSLS